ncbi:Uncharacterised protein [Candidatus Gugararchaeum adminiculabundum]|nr:Uncharacterised protein [Candidatus Gugararchaeum adminiculabundum]
MELTFPLAFILTNLLEMPVAYFFLWKTEEPKRILAAVLFLNALTLPFVWFIFPQLPFPYWHQLALSEIFAFGIEAILYIKIFKRTNAKIAALAAIAANFISLAIGLFLQQ